MTIEIQEFIPALSRGNYTVGTPPLTAEVYAGLEVLAAAILPLSPAKSFTGDMKNAATALIILDLFESEDLDKSSVSVLGTSYSRDQRAYGRSSYWVKLESMAKTYAKANRGEPIVERGDAGSTKMRLDNAGYPSFDMALADVKETQFQTTTGGDAE